MAKRKAKKGSRSNPHRIEVRIDEFVFTDTAGTIDHIYNSLKPRYKKVKGGQYANIIIKRFEPINGNKILVPEGEFLVKRGTRKLTNKVVSQISKQAVVELNEKYSVFGTPEVFEEDLDDALPERYFNPMIDREPTPEKKKRAKIIKIPFTKDKKGKFHDAKGKFISGHPRKDKGGRWRDATGKFIAAKKVK